MFPSNLELLKYILEETNFILAAIQGKEKRCC